MSKVKVACFSISLDGFGAGIEQSLENPLGKRGPELHNWFYPTKTFQKNVLGKVGGAEGVDNSLAEKSFENIGAWIIGRNMFGPVRGEWKDNNWKGWWGDEPPYHVPVYVLTHHKREPLVMKGGTVFYFATDGIESVLTEARKAAKGKDIRIGGGISTIRQFLQAGYIDEMHFAFSPVFLGKGENLFFGIDLPSLGFNKIKKVVGENATHIIVTK
ncbi:MAG: dihydrofolate reductase family protein [Candidatus Bilamarchaeum sp.]|jgi:dihydrofolate reductase